MMTAGGTKTGLTLEGVSECVRLDMPKSPASPPGPRQQIRNGDFSLLGTLWDILSGGWAITLGLATNLGLGLSAGMSQTFAQPWTGTATLEFGVGLNALNLSVLHIEIVCQSGTVVAYNDNPGPGNYTVSGIVISSPAQSIRVYATGVPGITLTYISVMA